VPLYLGRSETGDTENEMGTQAKVMTLIAAGLIVVAYALTLSAAGLVGISMTTTSHCAAPPMPNATPYIRILASLENL
jgi:hypothetical protein